MLRAGALAVIAASMFFAISPASAQSTDWSGVYLGGHAGGAWANIDWGLSSGGTVEPVNGSPSGFLGGGQIGAQYQWGPWVAGVELDYSAADLEDTVGSTVPDRSRSQSIDNIFLASLRIGYAMDRTLIYAKGGYASADVDLSTNVVSTGVQTGSSSEREDGWNIGAGIDYAFTPNIILGLQYDYISLDGSDRANVNNPAFAQADHIDVDPSVNVVTARLSYKFGGEREPAAYVPMK